MCFGKCGITQQRAQINTARLIFARRAENWFERINSTAEINFTTLTGECCTDSEIFGRARRAQRADRQTAQRQSGIRPRQRCVRHRGGQQIDIKLHTFGEQGDATATRKPAWFAGAIKMLQIGVTEACIKPQGIEMHFALDCSADFGKQRVHESWRAQVELVNL